ncbi:MAG: HAMP domain-containing histidine kinase [Thermoplasmata archaeon]|nr:HAMP domain-containing histidine kinase [Thermoplasmata archaeon]TFG70820.1 MAG: HAMP domain-containing histidine kinase [Methanomassiliicoccus sp.]
MAHAEDEKAAFPLKVQDKRMRTLSRIFDITTSLLNVEDIGVLLQRIVETVRGQFEFDRVSISIIDNKNKMFTDHALAGYSVEDVVKIKERIDAFDMDSILSDFRDDCRISRIAYYIPAEKQTTSVDDFIVVRDMDAALAPRKAPGMWHELDLLYFALHDRKGEMIGYMQVDYPVDHRIPDMETVAEIELFATIAAIGIENSRIYHRAKDLLKENELKSENTLRLLELSRSVLRMDDIHIVLQRVADAMSSAFGYRRVGASLFSKDSDTILVYALTGYSKEEEEIIRKSDLSKAMALEDLKEEFRITTTGYFIPGESQNGRCSDFVFIENSDKATTPRASAETWHELDLLYFGLYDREGHLIGIIQLDYPNDLRIPTRDEMESMEAYAGLASIAIGNSVMFNDMNDAKSRVKMYLDLLTHDVGNFVNPISAYLELVLTTTTLTRTQQKYIASAIEGTRSISHIIRNVRRSSEMLDNENIETVPRDLKKGLLQVASDVRGAFLNRNVDIRLNLPEDEVWVMSDSFMEEVFYNLLSNSVKYDDHDDVVIDIQMDVTEFEGRMYARTRVVDRGIGIPDDMKTKVFSRGFRDTKRLEARGMAARSKGAGMGLSLVKSLVDRYKGRVWVENRVYVDHSMGSIFNVLLPLP